MLPLRGTLRGRQSPGKAPAKPLWLVEFDAHRHPITLRIPSQATHRHAESINGIIHKGTVPQQIHIYIYNEFVKTFVSEFLASIGPLGQKVGTIGHQTTVLS